MQLAKNSIRGNKTEVLQLLHKTDGFTLAETLVSITLVLIVASAFSAALVSAMKNNDAAFLTLHESYLMLHADQKLREQIEPIIFPYWENSVNAAKILRQKIIDNTDIPEITIRKAEIIIKDGSAHGLEISYSLNGGSTIYKTAALFSSRGGVIKR